jgi:alkylation response protein AidB-like acyl-CoA dehydrogenase
MRVLAYSDPAFCLAYLAHPCCWSTTAVSDHLNKERFLPGTCAGTTSGSMCMSEQMQGNNVLNETNAVYDEGEERVDFKQTK